MLNLKKYSLKYRQSTKAYRNNCTFSTLSQSLLYICSNF